MFSTRTPDKHETFSTDYEAGEMKEAACQARASYEPADLPRGGVAMRMLRSLAARTLPPSWRWRLKDPFETVKAARQAENPIVGRRLFEVHMSKDPDAAFKTGDQVRRANEAWRSVKRARRVQRMNAKRRQGWV